MFYVDVSTVLNFILADNANRWRLINKCCNFVGDPSYRRQQCRLIVMLAEHRKPASLMASRLPKGYPRNLHY